MKWRRTIVESLEVKHPGLEKDVCGWLKGYLTGEEVAARLLKKYHETVSPRNINNYRRQRLDRVEQRIQDQKISYLAFMEAVGEKGLDAGAAAKLWEALQSMTPTELIAVRRLQVERARVRVLDKRAENEKQKLKTSLAQLTKKGAERGGDWKPPDPLEIRRRIRGIFGLPDDSAQFRKEGQTPGQATGSSVDAIHGINEQPDESKSEVVENQSEVRSPKSDDQNVRT